MVDLALIAVLIPANIFTLCWAIRGTRKAREAEREIFPPEN